MTTLRTLGLLLFFVFAGFTSGPDALAQEQDHAQSQDQSQQPPAASDESARQRPDSPATQNPAAVQQPGENFEALFRQGLQAYQTKDYVKARDLFAKAVETEPGNTAAMTNYALALFQSNDKGTAIAWFRRVLALEPERDEARDGLRFALSKLDVKEIPHRIETYETLRQNVLMLGTARLFLALTAILILAGGWLLIGWLGRRRRALRSEEPTPPFTFSLGILLTLTLCAIAFTALKLYDETLPRGTVIGGKIDARSAPAEDGASLFELYEGFEVLIREVKEGWVQVTYPGGLTGWIPKDRLIPASLYGL